MRKAKLALVAALATLPAVGRANVIYTENFDTDASGRWTFLSEAPGDTPADNFGNEADFFFDYSTIGIPAAPRSGGTTRGLKMEANVPGTGRFTGMSASPIGQAFTGDYTLRADVWQNFNGPLPVGGNRSTQMTWAGIGTAGTTAQFPGTGVGGVGFSASGEGGTASDYRAYTNVGAPLSPTTGAYAAGTQPGTPTGTPDSRDNTDAYYVNAGFGSETAPAAQLALFPQQSGTTAAGTQGMAWHLWEITKVGNTVTWTIDGVTIATVDVTTEPFAGGNIFVGHFDINATSSEDPNARSLLFGLVDNVEVIQVPEPGALSLLGLAGLAMLRRRRA